MKNVEIKISMSYSDDLGCVYFNIKQDGSEEEGYKLIEETTPNRALMRGIIEILNDIHRSSDITIYVQTNFGFKYLDNQKKWSNRDLGKAILDILYQRDIECCFIDCSTTNELNNLKQKSKKILQANMNLEEDDRKYSKAVKHSFNSPVKIFVRGAVDMADVSRPGKFLAILNYKGVEKQIVGFDTDTTINRMVITGAIEAIKKLKYPCNIELITHADIGYKSKSKVNYDLIDVLKAEVFKGNHVLTIKKTKERQVELKEKLNKFKYK